MPFVRSDSLLEKALYNLAELGRPCMISVIVPIQDHFGWSSLL